MTTTQAEAVRAYSADGENGQYQKINGYHRVAAKGKTPPPLPPRERRTSDELDEMFRQASGLKEPIRVYRGIGSVSVAAKAEEDGVYTDAGFTSASTELLPAMAYAQKAKVILVIDLPVGYPAVSIAALSRNPQEKEVLLPRDVRLDLPDIKDDSYNGYTLIYARPL